MMTSVYSHVVSVSITEQPMGFPFVFEFVDAGGNKHVVNLDGNDDTTRWHLSLLCQHDSAIRESIRLSKLTEAERLQSLVHDSTK